MHVIYTCGLLWALLQLGNGLFLGAFNIQSFGNTKASDNELMGYINEIVHRYDIILIQEILDADGSVTQKIMDRINLAVPGEYNYTVSEPLGETTYKERYLFLYRVAAVSVVKNYTYPDENFVLIPLHAKPTNAVKEVDALWNVAMDIKVKWATNDILLLGDFNAACAYVKEKDWKKIRLFTDKSFHWLISNDVDTTVAGRKCISCE
ncbi:hypothetical protein CRUP_022250 [Coryphaenoides rupestris]|nr:hypothetical protein CRUP_022250 [Coryphaenoides rupestris]